MNEPIKIWQPRYRDNTGGHRVIVKIKNKDYLREDEE